MTYAALVEHFSNIESLPIPIDEVINWVRNRTEHKHIKLHAVDREHSQDGEVGDEQRQVKPAEAVDAGEGVVKQPVDEARSSGSGQ